MDIRRRGKKLLILYSLTVLTALLDQLFKAKAEKHPEEFDQVVHNTGFAGERASDRPRTVRIISLVISVFSLILIPFLPEDSLSRKIRKAGWILMTGGGLSNTADRVFRHYVVDYIRIGKYVYNLGDLAIGAGSAVYIAGTLAEGSRSIVPEEEKG